MDSAATVPDAEQLWVALQDALDSSWQGRTVRAQLRTDRAGGLHSLRALLADAPPPPVAGLVTWYGVDNLVRAAEIANARRRPLGLLIGAGIAVVAVAAIAAVTLSTGGSKDPASSASSSRRPPSASAQPQPVLPAGPATTAPPSRTPVGTGPVVGDLSDPTVQETASRRLENASWAPFTRRGFSYRARAVMVHAVTVAGDSAPPGYHKLLFLTEVFNVQTDRPAPFPVGAGRAAGDAINVARTLVSDAPGHCKYPFQDIWASGDDQCALDVEQVGWATVSRDDEQIPAGASTYGVVGTVDNVPDSIADSQVTLYLTDDGGRDIRYVRVPPA